MVKFFGISTQSCHQFSVFCYFKNLVDNECYEETLGNGGLNFRAFISVRDVKSSRCALVHDYKIL
jgi:hypothetical protein